MLTYAAQIGADLATAVEAAFCRCEEGAVLRARATAGIQAVLTSITESGRSVTIVSNNAASAVKTHLTVTGMDHIVTGISARKPGDIGRLKPDPFLLNQAVTTLSTTPGRCVMVGDSVSDIHADHAAHLPVIAYADTPSKRSVCDPHQPSAIIEHMNELAATPPV